MCECELRDIHLQEVIAQHLSLLSSAEEEKTKRESQFFNNNVMQSYSDTEQLIWIL